MNTPRFSIITAMYQAEQFLGTYIEALHTQTFDMSRVEVLIIDDSSTDASAEILKHQLSLPNLSITVIPHQGQSAARNLGLQQARGEWVTFLDADDAISSNYLEAVDAAITAAEHNAPHPDLIPTVMAVRMMHLTENGTLRKARPASEWRFGNADAVINLNTNPDFIQSHISPCFIRRATLSDHAIDFSIDLTTAFEGPHLLGRLLMTSTEATLGLVQSAVYYFRQHQHSASSQAWGQAQRYLDTLEHGHLDLCQRALARYGQVPLWLANLIITDLCALLAENRSFQSATDWLSPTQAAACAALIEQVMERINTTPIESLYIPPQFQEPFQALCSLPPRNAFSHPHVAIRSDHQPAPGLTTLQFRYQGDAPQEQLFRAGQAVPASYSGTEDVSYFHNFGYKVRNLVVDTAPDLELRLNGHTVTLTAAPPATTPPPAPIIAYPLSTQTPTGGFRKTLGRIKWATKRIAASDRARELRMRAGVLRRHAATHPRETFFPVKGAWVCYDSFDRADDNAEHFYRYLATHHPEISAFYALDRTSTDWDRLEAEGFRLLDATSTQFQLICLYAECLISSHIDGRMLYPTPALRFARKRPFFVFLQHGVSKNDISMWLQPKPFDLIITTAPAEHEYFLSADSAYGYTDFHVALAGLPRWDRLLELAQSADSHHHAPHRILLMPTWRANLARQLSMIDDPAIRATTFIQSEYLKPWLRTLNSPNLNGLLRKARLDMLLVIHPALARLVDLKTAFKHDPRIVAMHETDVQELLVTAHTIVTDYSSIAFDAAYIDRNIVYFFPDGENIFDGTHTYRRGFFDESLHGFGPVVTSENELINALKKEINLNELTDNTYDHKRSTFFPIRDAKNCERTYFAIVRRLQFFGA